VESLWWEITGDAL